MAQEWVCSVQTLSPLGGAMPGKYFRPGLLTNFNSGLQYCLSPHSLSEIIYEITHCNPILSYRMITLPYSEAYSIKKKKAIPSWYGWDYGVRDFLRLSIPVSEKLLTL